MDLFFEKAIADHDIVLIDFSADWCAPCKWVVPILDEVEKHFNGKIKIQKIDIDEHAGVAKSMHILSVPTLVLFRLGQEVWRMRGFDTPPNLIKTIETYVK
jgi:thioredoxin 1